MPAFGSSQFLLGAAPGGDNAFKPGGGAGGQADHLQLSASGLKDGGADTSATSVLLQNPNGGLGGSLGGVTQSQPPVMKDTSLSERKHNLDLLETSFKNILTMQD